MIPTRSAGGFAKFNSVIGYLGGTAILLMMLVNVVDVLLRATSNTSISGAFELVEHLMVVIITCGLAYCGYAGGHITINVLDGLLDRPGARYLNVLVHVACVIVMSVIAWGCGKEALHAFQTGSNSNTLRIPHWPFYMAIGLGALAYAFVLLTHAAYAWQGKPLPSGHELLE